ncbi:Aste57867_12617 [Aphanomyces stellatus]|uniref:Aste57867_12617 protein n=1 Tax=Aphanomyces stellatus TaxID=120398 RepID=A0A485KWU5_9STRA|nr:hypothetical protein As57867_012571 [Aphanomyces stellatus]VFT89467.1 Aste57867_12617 [Aphanomyces stellatus]
MSFLARFENKISTVTMHGTLRRADGSEEVRSGPLRKKPQPAPMLPHVEPHDNNYPHQAALDDEDDNDDWYDATKTQHITPRPQSGRAADKPQVSPRKAKPQQPESPKKPAKKPPQPQEPEPTAASRNELKAATEGDQLAFSKKARPVAYEPCTLSEYRQEKQDKYYELGKLKPDLNAVELVEKRANMERIKEFSKNLRQINQATPKKVVTAPVEEKKVASTRDKALAFAKQKVPKPKVRKPVSPVKETSSRRGGGGSQMSPPPRDPVVHGRRNDYDDEEAESIQSELQLLQLKHKAARAQVEALMRD